MQSAFQGELIDLFIPPCHFQSSIMSALLWSAKRFQLVSESLTETYMLSPTLGQSLSVTLQVLLSLNRDLNYSYKTFTIDWLTLVEDQLILPHIF